MNKKGQVTIFVIIAILLVGGIIIYYALGRTPIDSIPQEFEGVYEQYLTCIDTLTQEGVSLLGTGGGYIETPIFDPASQFSPFSSQLNFLGQPIPYWMYLSGNNLLKEQIPTKQEMERQLATYIQERIETCDFTEYEQQGYDIYIDEGTVQTSITEQQVEVEVTNPLTLYRGETSAIVNEHETTINTKLGTFYQQAIDTYNYENQALFLENYALDVMRLYAPTTGTELSCTPKIFIEEHIRNNITTGLAANIASLKLNGEYYGLTSAERNYFVVDPGFNLDTNVNFLYDPSWPTRIEIHGEKVAKPVGIQEGLGILGFCYVPYHLVYDISFPVLIQFYEGEEIFQFPITVVIAKNQARQPLPSIRGNSIEPEVCTTPNQDIEVETYDANLNPVEAHIQLRCLDAVCSVGSTENIGSGTFLQTQIPQCVNGQIIANAEGYAQGTQQLSTNTEGIARIILNKKYATTLDLGNVQRAMITFEANDYSATIVYPDQKEIELIEGHYNVTVYAYEDSPITFPATNTRRCVDVPEEGITGFFGSQREECFNINIPETEITYAVVGGGTTTEYITEGQLQNSNELNINIPLYGTPQNIEQLQYNYASVEDETIYLTFE